MLLSLVTLGILIYSNTLGVPFCFDDAHNIEQNPHIRLTKLTFEELTRAAFKSPRSNRPIANLSFALNYYFHEYDVIGYHVVNIIIHIITAILLYFFLKTTLSLPVHSRKYKHHSSIAFFATLIWLVHPIQTQSVTYIVQRMNSMAAMFYVLSILLYTKGRLAKDNEKSWPWFAGCTLAGILSVSSKETAASLPFFIILYEWYFFQDHSKAWLRRHLASFAGILILFGLLAFVYMGTNPLEGILSTYAHRDFTLTERVLTQFRVIIYYISLLVYPHPGQLNLLHDFRVSHSLIDPISTLVSAGAIVGSIGLAFYLAKKEPLISFSILWFFGNLMIESSVIGLEIIFEHRTYLPSMFFFVIITILACRYVKRDFLKAAVLGMAVLLLCLWTYERNRTWNDPVTFWSDVVRKSPHNARAYNSLGKCYIDKRAYSMALTNVKQAIRLNPRSIEAHNNLGNIYFHQGLYDLAIEMYRKALDMNPGHHITYNNIGAACSKKGDVKKAIDMYTQAITIKSDFALAYSNLGILYLDHGRADKAIPFLRRAIELDPNFADAHNSFGLALINKALFVRGILELKEALRLQSDHADATFNLGRAYELTGQYEAAIAQYDTSIRLNLKDVGAYHNAGIVCLYHLKDKKRAMYYFTKALSIDPHYPESEEVKRIIDKIKQNEQ
jgi:tetratricopeptide (TPR) repeat protein